MNILITGTNGFIGNALLHSLVLRRDMKITAISRKEMSYPNVTCIKVTSLLDDKVVSNSLKNIDVVIHTAARVHRVNDCSDNSLSKYREINVKATSLLARCAIENKVQRFIFLSSIKVNGESTVQDKLFTEDSQFIPSDPYAKSKYEAEQELLHLSKKTGMEVVIVRPVLVYGPGVKANFLSMMNLVKSGIPLPLTKVENKRSLVSLDNLIDFITLCIEHPKAAGQIFLVSDDYDISTPKLLSQIAESMHKKPSLLPLPLFFLKLMAILLGKKAFFDRLCGSLQVDISKAKQTLEWVPPVSFRDAIDKTVQHFLNNR